MKLFEALKSHGDDLVEAAAQAHFRVFLCGPNLAQGTAAARLRRQLRDRLLDAGFQVVLGEDEGLTDTRIRRVGVNAQDNELEFIRRFCNAVVIVADSVGSFCELGLFSWHFVHEDGVLQGERKTDCIVLIDEKFKDDFTRTSQA